MEYSPQSNKIVLLFKKMLIGEVSKLSQLSRDTIRFYEKQGLIKVRPSDSAYNNYKNYSEENLEHLLLIKRAKHFGFTLNEISEILHLFQSNGATCSKMQTMISNKIEDINRKIRELEELKGQILGHVNELAGKCNTKQESKNCEVFD